MQVLMTNEFKLSKIDEIVDYLSKPRLWVPKLDYPDYSNWMNQVHAQIRNESKRAMTAIEDGRIIGTVLYQKHKILQDTLEIKNISISPEKKGRHIASFLLRNAEIEGLRDYNSRRVMVDTKANNIDMRSFLLSCRYRVLKEQDLYNLGSGLDVVFTKDAY